MAYAKVEETFWHDPTVRALSENGRHLFLYLLTSPHRNRIGCFALDPMYAAADLQWDAGDVQKALGELHDADRVWWDPSSRVVFIRRFLQYNTLENKNVVAGAVADLRALPDNPFLQPLMESLRESFRSHYVALQEALTNRLANSRHNGSGNRRYIPEPEPNQNRNRNPPTSAAADVAPPPTVHDGDEGERPPQEFEELLGDFPAAVTALASWGHPGGVASTVAVLKQGYLFEDSEQGAVPEYGMADKSLGERKAIVAKAIVELAGKGAVSWRPGGLASFVRTIVDNKRKRPEAGGADHRTARLQ